MGPVAAVAMCKDEIDIAESALRRMANQVDFLLVADNGSTDGTRSLLDNLSRELRLEVTDDPEVGYYQSRKMTALADRARERGAEFVVPFDLDEVWLARTSLPFSSALTTLPRHVLVVQADLYDHVATAEDPAEGDPILRMGWRRPDAGKLPKVACRAVPGLVIHQGNHGATFPGQDHPPTVSSLLTVRHFPYRSPAQLVRKARNGAAAYAATDLPDELGAHWRGFGRILEEDGPEAIEDVYRKWYWRDRPSEPVTIDGEHQGPLVFDPAPCLSPA